MKYLELKEKIKGNIFTFLDVGKVFFDENPQTINIQLFRFVQKGLIKKIKRKLYCFDEKEINEFELADRLYQPSYISLETALNFYGIIPDVFQTITSVTLTTTKRIKNEFGAFSYTKIKPQLFFGFTKAKVPNTSIFFNLAKREKALLDYFYLRKINRIDGLRLDLTDLDKNLYSQYCQIYPVWVQKIHL